MTRSLLVATFQHEKYQQPIDPQSETAEKWALKGGNIRLKRMFPVFGERDPAITG
jgi:hypothetical protein